MYLWLIRFPLDTINFSVADRRVVHDGLQFEVGDVSVMSSGSVGFDETLDLLLVIPIKDNWIGARPMLQGRKAALLTMTYLGAVQTIPNYNVMGVAKASLEANVRYLAQSLGPEGIRVNGVSAGPIRTLAAAGISNFRKLLDTFAGTAPLRRNVTIEDVGNAAAFLCSDLASGITGEITYVDGGYNIVGMAPLD